MSETCNLCGLVFREVWLWNKHKQRHLSWAVHQEEGRA